MAANQKPIGSFWTPPASFRVNGLLVVWDFCFLAVWAARPALKKKVWATFEGGFFMFVRAEKRRKYIFCSFLTYIFYALEINHELILGIIRIYNGGMIIFSPDHQVKLTANNVLIKNNG